jgi:hypothetical protein
MRREKMGLFRRPRKGMRKTNKSRKKENRTMEKTAAPAIQVTAVEQSV